MSYLQIGRLALGPPWQWYEGMGDPVTTLGGAAIPAPRQAIRHQISVSTLAADGVLDTVAARLALRRQLRSAFNNLNLKLQAFFYVIYSDDPEQNGWYVPDFGQLQDIDGAVGLATGAWKLDQVAWIKQGHLRTNREARNIWMKDLRAGLAWRDTLKFLYTVDFAYMPSLPLSQLPPGATSISNAVNGQRVPSTSMPAGRDGGITQQLFGLPDLGAIAFERPEANMSTGDVVVRDRRGNLNGPFYLANILQDNPTSYWRLDDASGTVATDLQGNNPGTYTGGFTLGQAGALTGGGDLDASVLLDGISGAVTLGANASALTLINYTQLTLECWANVNSIGTTWYLFAKQNNSAGYSLQILNTGAARFQLNATAVNGPVLTVGTWYHLVGTWDGATMRLYVNGALAGSAAFSGPILNATNMTPALGWRSGASFLPGNVDEAALYSYPLTNLQVANHYAAGACYDGGNQWEEVYGPDYPWSWTTGGAQDTPVIDNGLCRVRWDSSVSGRPGFRVDVWSATGAANGTPGWVEQGKLRVSKTTNNWDNVWVAAGIHTDNGYTPDRATVSVVLASSSDATSRDRTFITLQRGIVGATVEAYPSLLSNGSSADAMLGWSPAPIAAYKAQVLAASPISYWRLDETSGTAATDQEGNNGGTYTGGCTLNQTPGALAGGGDTDAAVLLNGSTGYIDTGAAADLGFTGAFSVEAWVKLNSHVANQAVVQKRATSSTGWWLSTDGGVSQKPRFQCVATSVSGPSVLSTGVWHHLVGTWDGSSTLTLYVDGVSVATAAFAGPLPADSANALIGADHGPGSFFNGLIDEVALYSYALSGGAVASHYATAQVAQDFNNSILKLDSVGSVSTTVAAGSNGVNVNTFAGNGVINVAATAPFTGTGELILPTSAGAALVTYTGTAGGNQFTGCTLVGGVSSGTLATGGVVAPALPGSWASAPPAVAQNSGPTPGVLVSTAGTGAGPGNSGMFGASATNLGAANFTASENWVALLRYINGYAVVAPFQTNFAVVQAANALFKYNGSDTNNYNPVTDNFYRHQSQNGAGYISMDLGFTASQVDQVVEAESMTLGAGTTAGGDPLASGAATTQSTRVTDANLHVSRATWPNAFLGTYRVFARVKTTGTQGSFYAKTGATTGAAVTVTGAATPGYTWVDLGELVANNTTLEIHAWVSSGTGVVEVDRVEAVLVTDQARTGFIYSGARDNGQNELVDARTFGAVVSR